MNLMRDQLAAQLLQSIDGNEERENQRERERERERERGGKSHRTCLLEIEMKWNERYEVRVEI